MLTDLGWSSSVCICLLALALLRCPDVSAITCYRCISHDGDNANCEDPFDGNGSSVTEGRAPCMGGRRLLSSLYPITACMKLSGVFRDSGRRILVRGCALDSGQMIADTGIIRTSHCGGLIFQDRQVRGCLQSCDDRDGCNSAGGDGGSIALALTLAAATTAFR